MKITGCLIKYGVKLNYGRTVKTIAGQAFDHNDQKKIPVFDSFANEGYPDHVIGYAVLHSREDGIYYECYLNQSEAAKQVTKIINKRYYMLGMLARYLRNDGEQITYGDIVSAAITAKTKDNAAWIDEIVPDGRQFTIPTKPYGEERIYLRKNVVFGPGVTVLVGCNGSGKSTLIMLMKDRLKQDKDILVLSYDDRMNGQSNLMSKFSFYQDFSNLAGMWSSSEGEKIFYGVSDFANGMHQKINQKKYKEVWIFMDAVGSGLSIDGILEIKDFAGFVIEQNPGMDIYFVISTNEYEFTRGVRCLDVTTFKTVEFTDYEDYREFILKTRKKKDQRRKRLQSDDPQEHA